MSGPFQSSTFPSAEEKKQKCWIDTAIIHRSHLVIPSVTFLFPLSQLLPVLPINRQSVLLQFTVTLSGVAHPPPSFIGRVGEFWVPHHSSSFRDTPVLTPRQHRFTARPWDLTTFKKNRIHTEKQVCTLLHFSVSLLSVVYIKCYSTIFSNLPKGLSLNAMRDYAGFLAVSLIRLLHSSPLTVLCRVRGILYVHLTQQFDSAALIHHLHSHQVWFFCCCCCEVWRRWGGGLSFCSAGHRRASSGRGQGGSVAPSIAPV